MAEEGENIDALQNQSDQTSGGEAIAHSSTQTAVDGETDPESILVEEIEFGGVKFGGNAYHDTYRNGNFGVKRGRVNFARAKIWSFAHLFTACTIIFLSLPCIIMSSGTAHSGLVDIFIVLSPLSGFFGLLTSCGGIHLSFSPEKLQRPLLVLLLLRVFALVECILVFPVIIFTMIVASETKLENPWDESIIAKDERVLTSLCGLLVISMVVEWITALAWLFHWWKYCICCQCLKSCCIFETGEPLAPGVPDPPKGLLHECVYVCWMAIFRSNWTLI